MDFQRAAHRQPMLRSPRPQYHCQRHHGSHNPFGCRTGDRALPPRDRRSTKSSPLREVLDMKVNTRYISHANMKQTFNKSEDIFYQSQPRARCGRETVDERLRRIRKLSAVHAVAPRVLAEFSSQFAQCSPACTFAGRPFAPSLIGF